MGLDMYMMRYNKVPGFSANDAILAKETAYFLKSKLQDHDSYQDDEFFSLGFSQYEKPMKSEKLLHFLKETALVDGVTLPDDLDQAILNWFDSERISPEVGYWRKAYHVHDWVMDITRPTVALEIFNSSGYDGNCVEREITKEQLEELLTICYEILAHKDMVVNADENYQNLHPKVQEFLEVTGGYINDSNGYGDYYFDSIENTVGILENILNTTNFDTQFITYCPSW